MHTLIHTHAHILTHTHTLTQCVSEEAEDGWVHKSRQHLLVLYLWEQVSNNGKCSALTILGRGDKSTGLYPFSCDTREAPKY